ncbi:MAG: hypothetical protein PHG66_01545 [Candidatus Colwellbacteria bacterium]|nr:hypothetical protein [Candidatus Colwellbacteria bacterium]
MAEIRESDDMHTVLNVIFGAFLVGTGGFICLFAFQLRTAPLIVIGVGLIVYGVYVVLAGLKNASSS